MVSTWFVTSSVERRLSGASENSGKRGSMCIILLYPDIVTIMTRHTQCCRYLRLRLGFRHELPAESTVSDGWLGRRKTVQ